MYLKFDFKIIHLYSQALLCSVIFLTTARTKIGLSSSGGEDVFVKSLQTDGRTNRRQAIRKAH